MELRSKVVRGFGRGGKQLGVPTANVEEAEVRRVATAEVSTGVYAGWAALPGVRPGEEFVAVASVGYNPHFGNDVKTIEPYLVGEFDRDFYGEDMRLVLCAYIRPELKFSSLQELKDAIWTDIESAKAQMHAEPWVSFKSRVLS